MSLSKLPDVCLQDVFRRLPLSQLLLSINLVNRQWNRVQKSIRKQQRTLSLVIGDERSAYHADNLLLFNPFRFYGYDLASVRNQWLHYAHLSGRVVCAIVSTFPNITSLQIVMFSVPCLELDHLVYWLRFGGHKLTSLKLWLDCKDCQVYVKDDFDDEFSLDTQMDNDEIESQLLKTIKLLPSLKHLTYENRKTTLLDLDLPTSPLHIDSLEELYFKPKWSAWQPTFKMYDSIFGYAQSSNSNLRSIVFGGGLGETEIDKFLSCNREIVNKISELSILSSHITDQVLSRLFLHFSNLTALRLSNQHHLSSKWTSIVAQLNQLYYLNFSITFKPDTPKVEQARDQITQLLTVKKLYLDIEGANEQNVEDLQLDFIFANLEALSFYERHYECPKCSAYVKDNKKTENCRAKMLSAIKVGNFKQLEFIKYSMKLEDSRNVVIDPHFVDIKYYTKPF